ncbi:MAG: AMP-binding protein [Gammaproteobacteria bacterium]
MNKPSSRTVPALLAEMSARAPSSPLLVGGDVRLSYAAFDERVQEAARALLASGVRAGDRVGLLMGNRAEWLVVYFAAMSLGAIAVGLNTWSTPHELVYQLRHSAVKLLFIEHRFRTSDLAALVRAARELGDGLPGLVGVVCIDEDAVQGMAGYRAFLARAAGVRPDAVSAAAARVTADRVACLLYTSGSTALPKGVPLQHGGLIDNMWEIGERQHLVAEDRLWLAVSLFWSLACVNAVFAAITHGAALVLQPQFEAGEALRLIEAERCTVFYGTPNMALGLWEHPSRADRDLSSLRTGVTIGTPAQVARVAALGAREICNVYGLTEAYGNSAVTDAHEPLERRIQTVGRPLPGVEIAILDGEHRPLPPGQAGEIALRGRLTPGYWQDAARSAEAFGADGFFRTGDLGLLDAEGYLHYRGRLKEMVKTGGINVAPAEVEEVLAAHPAVELAFVTGVQDSRLDEALAALIVLKAGAAASAEELVSHCRAHLAAYKTPRHLRFVRADELPLTTTGKLQRNRLPGFFG